VTVRVLGTRSFELSPDHSCDHPETVANGTQDRLRYGDPSGYIHRTILHWLLTIKCMLACFVNLTEIYALYTFSLTLKPKGKNVLDGEGNFPERIVWGNMSVQGKCPHSRRQVSTLNPVRPCKLLITVFTPESRLRQQHLTSLPQKTNPHTEYGYQINP